MGAGGPRNVSSERGETDMASFTAASDGIPRAGYRYTRFPGIVRLLVLLLDLGALMFWSGLVLLFLNLTPVNWFVATQVCDWSWVGDLVCHYGLLPIYLTQVNGIHLPDLGYFLVPLGLGLVVLMRPLLSMNAPGRNGRPLSGFSVWRARLHLHRSIIGAVLWYGVGGIGIMVGTLAATWSAISVGLYMPGWFFPLLHEGLKGGIRMLMHNFYLGISLPLMIFGAICYGISCLAEEKIGDAGIGRYGWKYLYRR